MEILDGDLGRTSIAENNFFTRTDSITESVSSKELFWATLLALLHFF